MLNKISGVFGVLSFHEISLLNEPSFPISKIWLSVGSSYVAIKVEPAAMSVSVRSIPPLGFVGNLISTVPGRLCLALTSPISLS